MRSQDFKISPKISRFQIRFLDFRQDFVSDFKISAKISYRISDACEDFRFQDFIRFHKTLGFQSKCMRFHCVADPSI